MAWPPDERPHYERLLAVLPEMMGTAEFARARATGRALTTETRSRSRSGRPAAG